MSKRPESQGCAQPVLPRGQATQWGRGCALLWCPPFLWVPHPHGLPPSPCHLSCQLARTEGRGENNNKKIQCFDFSLLTSQDRLEETQALPYPHGVTRCCSGMGECSRHPLRPPEGLADSSTLCRHQKQQQGTGVEVY